jgi:hypothetical protein
MDVIIHDNKKGTCILIDAAIPKDRNVIKKEAEKILKYIKLLTEIHCMWNVGAKVIMVITGANGTISKSLRQVHKQHTRNKEQHKNGKYWTLHAYYSKC